MSFYDLEVPTMRDPRQGEAIRFRDIVSRKDARALKQLVNDEYPEVLWGIELKKLSGADRAWALSAVEEAA